MYDLDIIEQRIMLIAKKMKLSKNKLLLNVSLNKSVFDNMKKGTIPSVDKIHKIADYLNCSVDFILGRTETSRLVKDIPDKIIDMLIEGYSKNPKKFISKEFVKVPTKKMVGQDYCFYEYCYDDYINIYDEAYNYATDNNIEMGNVTGVETKKEYMEMINIHNGFIDRMVAGKYYTLTQEDYNKFCEVYKLYIKAYKDYVKKLLDNVE